MESGPLVYSIGTSSQPSFVQQGQIDWVEFGKTSWKMTSAILQRFSSADIQPATFGAGLALGGRFQLGPRGRSSIDKMLSKLRGTGSFQKLIWFGFGYKSFIQLISESQPGVQCMALCACLADSHSDIAAGYILSALWDKCEFPKEYQPSHEQFVKLIKACEGALASTSFGETVERILGSERYNAMEGKINRYLTPDWERCAKDTSIAEVLCALFDITNGRITRIQVYGAAECAFIGAIAEWLFDLTIHVESDDGKCLYSTSPEGCEPQVRLRFTFQDSEGLDPRKMQITQTTYYLTQDHDFWSELVDRESSLLITRITWESCLSRSFGNAFDELCKLSVAFGNYLGAAARIYTALALGEANLGIFEDCRPSFVDFPDGCHGTGLISTIFSLFPELKHAKDLEKFTFGALDTDFTSAVSNFQSSSSLLAKHCSCEICDTKSPILNMQINLRCLPSIAFAVLQVSRCLASLQRHSDLLPTITGIRHFYHQTPRNRIWDDSIRPADLIDELDLGDSYGDGMLIRPLTLFSGTQPLSDGRIALPGRTDQISAISWGGLSVFYGGLRRISTSPSELRTIHIIPGHIQRGFRQYSAIYDQVAPAEGASSLSHNFFNYNALDPSVSLAASRSEVRAAIAERAGSKALRFVYEIDLTRVDSNKSMPQPALLLPPCFLTRRFLKSCGLISCARNPKFCARRQAIECQATPADRRIGTLRGIFGFEVTQLKFENEMACCISSRAEDDIDRWIALMLHSSGIAKGPIYARQDECLPCCMAAVLRDSADVLRQVKNSSRAPEKKDHVVFQILNTRPHISID